MTIDLNRPIANHVHNLMDYFRYLQRTDSVPLSDYSWSHHWWYSPASAADYAVEDCDVVQRALVMEAILDVSFRAHSELVKF